MEPTELLLEVDQEPFCPGDQIRVRITLVPSANYQVRQGRLALVCTEVYYSASDDGYSRSTNELVRWTESFLENTEVAQGIPYRGDHSFPLPSVTWPTAHGENVDISWHVEASIDIAGTSDIHSRQPVVVLSPYQHPPTQAIADRTYPECDLSFSVSPIYVRTGEVLEGSMQVQMRRNLSVRRVWMELRCTEKAGDRETKTAMDEISLYSGASLKAGETYQWPFRVQVPEIMLPAVTTQKSTATWSIRGIIDRRMRRDMVVERQVQVFTAPRQG